MKTIQTFALLILLFAAKTYCQENVASEKAEASVATETKVPENLAAILDGTAELEGETDSSTLPSQDAPTKNIEVNSPSPQKEEEHPEIIPEIEESSSIVSESDPSPESPEETTQLVDKVTTLSESGPEVQDVNSPDSPQKEEETPAPISEIQESSSIVSKSEPSTASPEETTQIVDKVTTLSESGPEVQAVDSPDSPQIPEIQESISVVPNLGPSTESPEVTPQIVDEATTLSESGPEVQAEPESTSEHQQPLGTIICVCNCGVDSDLPQNCEESSSKAAVLESENATPTESTNNDPLVPEIEKEAEDEKNRNNETEAPSEGEPRSSTLEPDTSITNEGSTEPIGIETETGAPQKIENSEGTPSNNEPQEEAELIVNNESTTATDEATPSAVTESETKLNIETTSNLSNPPTESTEANHEVSSEPEPTITIDPLEVSSTTISPCTEVGDISNPTNCRQFLSCSGNTTNLVSQELQCPERSAFNPVLRRCTRDLSPCLDEEPICLRTSSIANPNGENNSYYWCVPNLLGGFHKYHIQCAENEIFIPLIGRCWLENPQLGLGLGFGLINREPSDRNLVIAEWKLLKRETKQKAKAEKLRKKMEEKAKARAEKLAAKELKKQKGVVRKVDDDDDTDD